MMIRKTAALLMLLPTLAESGACQRVEPPSAAQQAVAGPQAEPAAPVAPLSSHGEAGAAAAAAGPGQEAAIDFELPAGWQRQTPSSNMRLAQATIPGPGGPGELAVFFFGAGQGGAVEANLQRWVDQMGGATPRRDSFESHGLKVTWIEMAGTLQPTAMGMGSSTPQPNSRLLGAVVEGPGGPWFFKATGPDSTLGPQRDAFIRMLKSVRSRSASS